MPHPRRHASQGHSAAAYSKENGDLVLQAAQVAGIKSPKELANFMGQMQVESAGFRRMHENLNYRPERLLEKFQGRNGMNTLEQAQTIVKHGPQKIAETIYGGEWGKHNGGPGNTEPGDGWKFHGRGFVQLTGRYNYERYGKALGLDLLNQPDLAAEPANAAKIAVQYWKETVAKRGHQTDVTRATEDINGGRNSLKERKAAVAQWEVKLAHGYKPGDPEPGQSLQDSPLFKQAKSGLEKIRCRVRPQARSVDRQRRSCHRSSRIARRPDPYRPHDAGRQRQQHDLCNPRQTGRGALQVCRCTNGGVDAHAGCPKLTGVRLRAADPAATSSSAKQPAVHAASGAVDVSLRFAETFTDQIPRSNYTQFALAARWPRALAA